MQGRARRWRDRLIARSDQDMGESSKSQNHGAEPKIDNLSPLPDELLLQILSFMEMREVVRTSILSRRWLHLWKSIPNMNFWLWWKSDVHQCADFVERSLALRNGAEIKKFGICFCYEDIDVTRLNSWISFVVNQGVKELDLCLIASSNDDALSPPDCIFTSRSLVTMTLRYCKLNQLNSVHLCSLKTLYLKYAEFTDDDLRILLHGCPLLEDLTFYNCNPQNSMNIVAENPRLRSLKLIDNGDSYCQPHICMTTTVRISAPHITSLLVSVGALRNPYEFGDMSSLVCASIDIYDPILHHNLANKFFDEILKSIRSVEVLKLSHTCIEQLSRSEATSSWKPILPDSVLNLELKIRFCKFELAGLVCVLKRSIKLEVLSIDIVEDDFYMRAECISEASVHDYWNSFECYLMMLQHIKIVKIRGIFLRGKYLSKEFEAVMKEVELNQNSISQETREKVLEVILKGEGYAIDFIRILHKKRATLETFTITRGEKYAIFANLVFKF